MTLFSNVDDMIWYDMIVDDMLIQKILWRYEWSEFMAADTMVGATAETVADNTTTTIKLVTIIEGAITMSKKINRQIQCDIKQCSQRFQRWW